MTNILGHARNDMRIADRIVIMTVINNVILHVLIRHVLQTRLSSDIHYKYFSYLYLYI